MRGVIWLVVLLLTACAANQPAPVIDRGTHSKASTSSSSKSPARAASGEKDWRPGTYTVKKGDTLYSIGLEYGLDYKDIAQWNNIAPPYTIYIGRVLKFNFPKTVEETPPSEAVVVTPIQNEQVVAKPIGEPPLKTEPKAIKEPYSEQAMTTPKPVEKVTEMSAAKPAEQSKAEKAPANGDDESIDWGWPTQGKISSGFNEAGGSKGIDILGTQGQPVLAVAPGKVVYSGSGLRGYGKLVIIKHNKTYLSAYAHNSRILVKEGQDIAKGQKIAEMGDTDTDKPKLHFEIRKLGKPVDPAKYLPEKS